VHCVPSARRQIDPRSARGAGEVRRVHVNIKIYAQLLEL
jgi:hypothetical protein